MNHPSVQNRNRRLCIRRPAKRSSKVNCRKGTIGFGPNLGVPLLDVSEAGVRMIAKTELKLGQEVEVGMLPPGGTREVARKGRVAWMVPTADGQICVGVQFEKRLEYARPARPEQPADVVSPKRK